MGLDTDKPYGDSTLAVHGGEAHQKAQNSITDPVVMASTYTFNDTQAVIDYIEQKQARGEYGRYGNPNESVVEKKISQTRGRRGCYRLCQWYGRHRRGSDGQIKCR